MSESFFSVEETSPGGTITRMDFFTNINQTNQVESVESVLYRPT